MSILQRPLDIILLLLLCNFMFFNLTIERTYCSVSLEDAVKEKAILGKKSSWSFVVTPLAETTRDFCKATNPLFIRRDPWMKMATCISAYGLFPAYIFVFIVFLFGINRLAKWTLFVIGTDFLHFILFPIFFLHFVFWEFLETRRDRTSRFLFSLFLLVHFSSFLFSFYFF